MSLKLANLIGILVVGLHQGQRTYAPRHQAGHMTAADQTVQRKKSACHEAVHICLIGADAGHPLRQGPRISAGSAFSKFKPWIFMAHIERPWAIFATDCGYIRQISQPCALHTLDRAVWRRCCTSDP